MKHFIQISDCHIDNNAQVMGVDSHANLKKVVDEVTKLQSDAVIMSGDLAHNGTRQSYQTLKQILAPINTDIFAIAGNHDNFNNLDAELSAYLFNTVALGAWEIVTINSVQADQSSGFVNAKALEKLDKQLQNSKAQYIVVVLHHPIVPMNSQWDDALSLKNPQDLLALLDKHPKAQAVLFGHAHEAAEFNKNGLKIIACPSTALQFNHEKRIGFNYYTLFDNGQFSYKTQWITR